MHLLLLILPCTWLVFLLLLACNAKMATLTAVFPALQPSLPLSKS